MIKRVRMFNDKALKTVCTEVADLGSDRVKEIAQDMIDTMKRFKGIGLASPQIGITERIIVVTDIEKNEPVVFVNPEIVMKSEEMEKSIERMIRIRNSNAIKKERKLSDKEIISLYEKLENLSKELDEIARKNFEHSWSNKNQKDKLNYLMKLIKESNDNTHFEKIEKIN